MTRKLRVSVVDYGAGNLRSVTKALESLGADPFVTSDPDQVVASECVVLPGVGSGPAAMKALRARELTEAVKQVIQRGRPFFGVCLGLQLLLDWSEEGDTQCLGVIPGLVRRFTVELKVPHMGWNQVEFTTTHPVFSEATQGGHYYFVHSYYPEPMDRDVVAATTNYGIDFCAAIARGNLVATQFHPEKSGLLGLQLYESFLRFVAKEG